MSADVDIELIRSLGTKFIERRDVKAVMDEPMPGKGGPPLPWQPIRSPFTMEDFAAHLEGRRTFGHYMVSPVEDTCKLFALDIDLRENKPAKLDKDGEIAVPAFEGVYYDDTQKGFLPCNPREDWGKVDHPARPYLTRHLAIVANLLAQVTAELGIDVAVSLSGNKGLHVYGFTGPIKASFAKESAIEVLKELDFYEERGDVFFGHVGYPNLMVEVFPKQDSLDGKDLGNLMALPLGIHRKTGKKKQFVRVSSDSITVIDPHEALGGYRPWET